MSTRLCTYAWGLLWLSLSLNCRNDQPIARVGDTNILAADFRNFLHHHVVHAKWYATHEQRVQQLEHLIHRELALGDALAAGFDKDPDIRNQLEYYEKKAVSSLVREKEIVEKVIPERALRSVRDKMAVELRFRHILKTAANRAGDSTRALHELNRIRMRILQGEDLATFARTMSEDTLSARNGGDLGYVRWGYGGYGEHFYHTVFQLRKRHLSQPIRSLLGYHLVLVEDRRTIPLPPLEEMKEDIRKRFFAHLDEELETRERVFLEQLRCSAGSQEAEPSPTDEELFIRWGYQHRYQHHEKVKQALESTKRLLLLKKIEQRRIYDRMRSVTEEDFRSYYLKHADRYFFPEARLVQQIFIADSALAAAVAERARHGEDFDALAVQYNERNLTRTSKGVVGFLTQDQQDELGGTAAGMTCGEISMPVEGTLGYSIIKILAVRPKTGKTFLQAKREVEIDLYQSLYDNYKMEWLDELRKSITVQIFPDRLKHAFSDSTFS